MNERTGMTEEQYRQLEAQMNMGMQQNDTANFISPENVAAGAQLGSAPQQGRVSQQQALRERMMASRGQQVGQQVHLEQTDTYQPNQSTQATPQYGAQGTPAQQQQQTTIINTTQESKKSVLGNKLIFIVIGIVIVAVILGMTLLKGKGTESDNQDEFVPDTEDLVWLDPIDQNTFIYSPDEITQLREAGYTGNEIEDYQSAGTPADVLIKEAKAARDAWVQEAIAPLYDTASDEYKHYVSQTWLTLPERDDAEEWTELAGYYTERKNLDYEKVDVYGKQLFIKVYLDDNTHNDWFFLCVNPEEWNKLNDKGNVIVNYTYCTRYIQEDEFSYVEDTSSIYITEAYLEIIE